MANMTKKRGALTTRSAKEKGIQTTAAVAVKLERFAHTAAHSPAKGVHAPAESQAKAQAGSSSDRKSQGPV